MKKNFTKIISTVLALLMLLTSMPLTALAATSGEYTYNIVYSDNDATYIEITAYKGNKTEVEIPQTIDGYVVKSASNTFYNNKNVTKVVFPEGLEYIGTRTFTNSKVDVVLPSTLKAIGYNAFPGTTINSINFPEGLLGIGVYAFTGKLNCELKLPESLKYLAYGAFKNCDGIGSVEIGKNVIPADPQYNYSEEVTAELYNLEEESWSPFVNCKLDSLTVDEENPYVMATDNTLYSKDMQCLLYRVNSSEEFTDVNIPEGVRVISENAFERYTNIDTLHISSTVEKICFEAFCDTTINNIEFAENSSLKTIESSAFRYALGDCELVLPKSVERIEDYAFANCGITSLSFETPSNCKTILEYAFSGCKSLKKVFIPNSVTTLGNEYDSSRPTSVNRSSKVFSACDKLEEVTFEDNSQLTMWGTNLFSGCNSLKTINTGKNNGVKDIYCGFSNAKFETLDLSNCPNLSHIAESIFKGNKTLKSINLSSTNLSSIEWYVFEDCTALEEVILPETVTEIGAYAFQNCKSLKSINLDNVYVIGEDAFDGCDSLDQIVTEREIKEANGFKYSVINDHVAITGYTGNDTNIVIPNEIENLPVTIIGNDAFADISVNSIQLPSKLEIIGNNAFRDCGLELMPYLPENLTSIGSYAFAYNNKLTDELVIPGSVKAIKDYAFYATGFTSIKLNEGLISVGYYALGVGDFESIVFPDSVISVSNRFVQPKNNVKYIKFGAGVMGLESTLIDESRPKLYRYYPALEEVEVSDSNLNYSSQDGVVYNKNKTVLIYYPVAKPDNTYAVPETVKEIAQNAFNQTAATKNIVLPDSLTKISYRAFFQCESIININIPGSVTEIEEEAFYCCSGFNTIVFDEGIKIHTLFSTFWECKDIENVIFPENAEIYKLDCTFMDTAIKSIVLPDSITVLETTFYGSALEEITLPKNLETIGYDAFARTNLKSIVMPEKVTVINGSAFSECENLSYVNLSNVKSIGAHAFYACTALESIDLTGVTYVSPEAFKYCYNLKKFYFTKDELEAYIAENEFKGNETLETIVVGNSITSIEDGAFADCTNLETALIAQSVTSIADTAFDNCDNLSIVCMEDSYAQAYAERKAIPYTTFTVAPIADQKYTGYEIKPELSVSAQGKDLIENTDYTAVFEDNINVGTAKVNVLGLGDYSIFASLVRFNIVSNGDIPQIDEDDKSDPSGDAETDNGKDNTADNKSDSTQTQNKNGANTNNAGSNTQDDVKNDTASSVSKTNQSASNQTADNSVADNSASADSENSATAENTQSGEQNKTDSEEKTADEPASENDTDSKQDEEKKLSFWQKLLNMILNFFSKLIDIIKNLFA
ncbi:MAG: leucine-rich repeat protein [Eubacterium sp.]|nr:leucine-rich repeat protein [Eubacterium sp.]